MNNRHIKDDASGPPDGGAFERTLCRVITTVGMSFVDGYELLDAHRADRAADRQRIAELETAKDNYKQMVVEQKQRIAELEAQLEAYRHANGSKAARIQKMKEQYEEDFRNRKQHIAELEEQLPKVVTPVGGKCPNCGSYCGGWGYCCHCGAKLKWAAVL